MTPQEELFADLFNGYKTKPSVNAMADLELRAHREELSKIAFEAKAYIYAVDEILKERKPKGPQGFAKSVNTDETTTNAINTIKERQKRLSKNEKIQAGLQALFEKSGMSAAEAEKEANSRMSAGNILTRIKDKASRDILTGVNEPKTIEQVKPIFNPFEKKKE